MLNYVDLLPAGYNSPEESAKFLKGLERYFQDKLLIIFYETGIDVELFVDSNVEVLRARFNMDNSTATLILGSRRDQEFLQVGMACRPWVRVFRNTENEKGWEGCESFTNNPADGSEWGFKEMSELSAVEVQALAGYFNILGPLEDL